MTAIESPLHFTDVGLSADEYAAVVSGLGREPTEAELRLFGVMWSEHCSYKSTRELLGRFNQQGRYVLGGQGENAGLVNIDGRYALAFKVESHNHPSAVEPFQGAATGVGGIIRDILTMGAYPIALMDGLFFGDTPSPSNTRIQHGVVEGVGHYGNCVGIPNVGGKTVFDRVYGANPLVNAFCIGLLEQKKFVSSKTAQPDQLVLVLGSHTGRDGIAGAAFASVNLSEDNTASRPNIQIGDPFAGKRLIDCVHELLDAEVIACMQDMGAAGIISSTSEVADKSGVGLEIHLDRVHTRTAGMKGWEIALSESQERMLLIVAPNDLETVKTIAAKWDIGLSHIGETNRSGRLVMTEAGKIIADLDAGMIGGNAPVIPWSKKVPDDLAERQALPPIPNHTAATALLPKLLSTVQLREKSYIWQQYDSRVQLRTVQGHGAPVALLNTAPAGGLIALSFESEPHKCHTHPYDGAAETMAAAVRNLAVSGAEVAGISDCLNFASPAVPEHFYELSECIRAMADVSHDLSAPVISGNVSLYNQNEETAVYPTPVVVGVGIIPEDTHHLPSGALLEGNRLYLVGPHAGSCGASLLMRLLTGKVQGVPVSYKPDLEKHFIANALITAQKKLAVSARPIGSGGLLTALAKECIAAEIGAAVTLPGNTYDPAVFFGEGGPRALYAVEPEQAAAFEAVWQAAGVYFLGTVGGHTLDIQHFAAYPIDELRQQNLPLNSL